MEMENMNITAEASVPARKRGRPPGSKNKKPKAAANKEPKKARPPRAPVSAAIDARPDAPENAPENAQANVPTVAETGIGPWEYKVLVRPDDFATVSDGGIIIPDADGVKARSRMKGTIIALSPAAMSYYAWGADVRLPKPGDRVLFAMHSGSEHKGKDGVTYWLINDRDIGALLVP